MKKTKIFAHCAYIGETGYNLHSRDFFRSLSNYVDLKIRNYTIGKTWDGYSLEPHNNEPYIDDLDKKLLTRQILTDNDGKRRDYIIYPNDEKEFNHDLNIVLCETNHHIFYDSYKGPKIAYNVWESTLQPTHFFEKLKEFDELWVPSKWQRDCTILQGYDKNKIKVVPEGVDDKVFFPDESITHELTNDGRFKFFLAGRWDYRKSTKEIIESFLKTFDESEPVDLIISVDNPYSGDGLESTENRLKYFNLEDERIKIIHFPKREEYIKILKSCHSFVSCARSEGWNLPLIESMACGTPSIYSNCSGQLEFAAGKGIPVEILGERPVSDSDYNHFNTSVGNYYEPNFVDLSKKMREVYESYDKFKEKAISDSIEIRSEFNWDNVSKIALETIDNFISNNSIENNEVISYNKLIISYNDGPRVEIKGEHEGLYHVEFLNKETGEILHSDTIKNNMWVACSKKYYIPWQIKINGKICDELDLNEKIVLISLESKSLGDTIAWAPYSVEFAKKHNCKVVLSTFNNYFFENLETYKDIKFIKPGESHDCHAIYRIGWFKKDNKWGDYERNPTQVNIIPLQKTASDILGLEFKEINLGIDFPKLERPSEKDYIVFGPNATSGCKEWSYDSWVTLSKMLKEIGYEVITLTQKPFNIEGVKNIDNIPLPMVANYLHHAKAFVGLGSGLSWLNWSLGKHTYMINGFARPDHEFVTNITKIYNDNVCVFCWNDEEFVFDPGDWDWCPVYKGTKKQHICQKSITPLQVFNKLIKDL